MYSQSAQHQQKRWQPLPHLLVGQIMLYICEKKVNESNMWF